MKADPDVRVLKLNVKNDIVSYIYATASSIQPDKLDSPWVNEGRQRLANDAVSDDTITTLIEQLTFLSDLQRDQKANLDEERLRENLGSVVRVLGEHLYNVLFKGQILEGSTGGAEACLNTALKDGSLALIRVELTFSDQEGNNLRTWPWEYLYKPADSTKNSDNFLIRTTQFVLNRMLIIEGETPGIETNRPVRVLLVVVQPKNYGPVVYNKVKEDLERLQSDNLVELLKEPIIDIYPSDIDEQRSYTPKATRKYLRQRAHGDRPPHIIHFIGHGFREGKVGKICLVKESGEADPVSDQEFANLLANSPDLKMVFLQACESGLPSPYRSISGMAMRLAHTNIPAVVAMQYKVANDVANNFAHGFYEALAKGQSVDLAVKAGREEIQDEDEQQIYAFGLPVLYLRSYKQVILPPDEKSGTPGTPVPAYPKDLSNAASSLASEDTYKCPVCGKFHSKKTNRCPTYGTRLKCIFCDDYFEDPTNDKYCGKCPGWRYCKGCGKELTEANAIKPPKYEDTDYEYCKECYQKQQSTISDNYTPSRQQAASSPVSIQQGT